MKDLEDYLNIVNNEVPNLINQNNIPITNLNSNDKWTGEVIDDNDPLKMARVKIRIYGFYDNLRDQDIPWAMTDINYLGSVNGNMIIPPKGTIVRGYFDKGDVQKPIYDSIASNINYTSNSKTDRNEDYPYKMVLLETEKGDYLTLNRKNGELVFVHNTGAMFVINEQGNISIKSPTTTTITDGIPNTHKGNIEIEAEGNITINANSDIKINAMKNVDITSTLGTINLGNNPAKNLVCNLPSCLICGAPHAVGNVQVKA